MPDAMLALRHLFFHGSAQCGTEQVGVSFRVRPGPPKTGVQQAEHRAQSRPGGSKKEGRSEQQETAQAMACSRCGPHHCGGCGSCGSSTGGSSRESGACPLAGLGGDVCEVRGELDRRPPGEPPGGFGDVGESFETTQHGPTPVDRSECGLVK